MTADDLAAIEARVAAATPADDPQWDAREIDAAGVFGRWADAVLAEHAPADIRALCAEVRLLRGAAVAQEARDAAAAQRAGLPPGGCDTSDALADEVLELRALLSECRTALAECLPSPRRADLLRRLDAAPKGSAK